MQLMKTIELGGGTITIKELRVTDVRNLYANWKQFDNITVNDLLLTRLNDVQNFLAPIMECNGVKIDDLSFSELNLLKKEFIEVNEAFLELTGYLSVARSLALNQSHPISTDSIKPAPASSNEGITA